MRESIKTVLEQLPAWTAVWGGWRRRQFLRDYRSRRDRYAALAREQGLVYDAAQSAAQARARVEARGHTLRLRQVGVVHTLAFVPRLGWHALLIDELKALGPVSLFDYTELGITWMQLYRGDVQARRRLNAAFVRYAVERAHDRQVDWIFVYASGTEIEPSTVREVQERVGAPVVGMCFDDKNSWAGPYRGGYRTLQVDLAPVLDLVWTSARVACEWYLVEGGRPVYLPEGCAPALFRPLGIAKDIDVSFVGERYGYRPRFLARLARAGVSVQAFGRGWPQGSLSFDEYVQVLNRSRINLGLGGIGYVPEITNVKARDFEVPCAGGGVYLTTYNPDLALHFHVGREILCYRDVDEAVELIRYYLAHPEESNRLAARARTRCLEEHTWQARFGTILGHLGVIAAGAPAGASGRVAAGASRA